jgi:sugar/nucleoside kinase (ribokinase family)
MRNRNINPMNTPMVETEDDSHDSEKMNPPRTYDLCGMGNPLVDVLFNVEDSFLEANGLRKGIMHLIDKKRKDELLHLLAGRESVEEIGGSCPNTIVTLALLGAKVALTGKIGTEEYGDHFEESIKEKGIASYLRRSTHDTGVCTILITPDKERTMNTYLGACREYTVDDLPVDMITNSRYFYVTGYMWDTKNQKEAISYALEVAKRHGVKVVFDIADPFAVERHRDNFLQIIEDSADIVFANAQEAHLLNEAQLLNKAKLETATECLGRLCELAVVKNGAHDTTIYSIEGTLKVPSYKTRVMDTTGAGDNFAAGFLYGLIQGLPLEQCGQIASFVASKTIEKIGAQAPKNIRELVRPLMQVAGNSSSR